MQRGPLLHVQISLRCFTGNCYLLANELPTSGPFASVPKQVLVPIAEEGHRALADHPIDHSGKVESGIKFPFGVGSILPLVLETISFLIIGWIFIFWFVDKVFFKDGPFLTSFSLLTSFLMYNWLIKFDRCLGSNWWSLGSKATTLPTEPQPLAYL